jgi:hypothetical protein
LRGFFRIRAGDWRLGAITYRILDPGGCYETGRVPVEYLVSWAFTVSFTWAIPGYLSTSAYGQLDRFFLGEKMAQFSRDHCEALVYRSYLLGCVSWWWSFLMSWWVFSPMP